MPKSSRIGLKFAKEIEEIKDKRLLNGKAKERNSSEKITNMITHHDLWKKIAKEIIESPEEEVNKYGK